jgi:hypothetical protein
MTIEWSGSKGEFYYFDKTAKAKIPMKSPFYGFVIDEANTIVGFHEKSNKGIWSNEVKDLSKEQLNVRVGSQTMDLGLYDEIKDAVKTKGGKYCKVVYFALISETGKELSLVKIRLSGSALAPFIDGKFRASEKLILKFSTNPESKKKGATVYFEPTIEKIDKKNEVLLAKALELGKVVSDYFSSKTESKQDVAQSVAHEAAPIPENENDTIEDIGDLPF